MSAPSAGPRLLRAAVFTAVCLVLSGLGHVLAACETVPWWTLALGFLGVFAVTVPFAGRERSLPVIATALTGGQLALHVLFGLGQRQHLTVSIGDQADDALIRMAAKLVCGAGASSLSPVDAHRIVTRAGLDPAAAAAEHAGHAGHLAEPAAGLWPSLPMVLGHLLAALATGWLLRRGDLALVKLGRLSAHGATELAEGALVRSLRAALVLVRALLAGLPALPAGGPRPARTDDDPPTPTTVDALQHTVIRRGPPTVSLCVLAA
ncbi:hypothetical protein [Streptomyces sp. CB03238]|uniref:hypothetical protein n=1 Tax=Streptomyces sp. CB03238 TaxID=1907777 RepID=UPI000A0F7844|nr:hypothetical protein [Streptomyces sp. CB03238]ORT57702.1 hypothetical protein BKD26_21140 [Streptomyces sp. CB03238]